MLSLRPRAGWCECLKQGAHCGEFGAAGRYRYGRIGPFCNPWGFPGEQVRAFIPGEPRVGTGLRGAERDTRGSCGGVAGALRREVRDSLLLVKWCFRIWGPRVRTGEGPAPIAQRFGLNGNVRGHPQWERMSVFGQFAAFPLNPSPLAAVPTPALPLPWWDHRVLGHPRFWASSAARGL